MVCPKCGALSDYAFMNFGQELSKDFKKIFMSAVCYECRADIELEYTCTLCELDEEVTT